jgi:hypothetical protein
VYHLRKQNQCLLHKELLQLEEKEQQKENQDKARSLITQEHKFVA